MNSRALLDVAMPQLGVAVDEGVVVAWLVAVGDRVSAEQPVCQIATDKVDTDVLAPADGVIAELVVFEGDTVAVGAPVARIAVGDAAAETNVAAVETAAQPRSTPASGGHAADVLAGANVDPAAAADAALSRPGRLGGPICSPVARRLAAEHGVDLGQVRGSGRRGRISKADVLALVETGKHASVAAPPAAPVAAAGVGLPRGYEDVPHEIVATSHQRRAISEHMIRSRQTAAHMTTEVEVDMHRVSEVRRQVNAARAAANEGRVSFLSFIARAAIVALTEHPGLNATFEHDRSIHWREVNLGVAVDTPGGLIVPVIRGAQRLTVGALADAIADLGERARARRLTPDDVRAGTFTISNPGSVGAVSAAAIINQPQVAVLGTPAIVKRPWVVTTADGADAIVPRPIMKLALTFDHRAVDGAEATRYIVLVKQHLEAWGDQDYS